MSEVGATEAQEVYTNWINRCHRPLSADDKKWWRVFYERSFARFNRQSDFATYLEFLQNT